MFSPFLLPPQKTEGNIKHVKDLKDALDFGAQVFSAVRSGWLSPAVQSCFREAAAVFTAEAVEYPAKEFL